MITRCIFLILVISLSACGTGNRSVFPEDDLFDLSGERVDLNNQSGDFIRVFMFLTYDCPLSVSYTGPMNKLVAETSGKGVQSYFVFPGLNYQDDSVSSFISKYRIEAPVIFDPEYKLTKYLEATVTPQVIIMDSQNKVAYTGAFDDWAFEPGRKRQVVNNHYVKDAVAQLMAGVKPDPSETEPVGCYIEY